MHAHVLAHMHIKLEQWRSGQKETPKQNGKSIFFVHYEFLELFFYQFEEEMILKFKNKIKNIQQYKYENTVVL